MNAFHGCCDEELERVGGRNRPHHPGCLADLIGAQDPEDDEPDDHHRAEHLGDAGRAASLDHEQPDQDHHGDRDHPTLERGRGDLETLDR